MLRCSRKRALSFRKNNGVRTDPIPTFFYRCRERLHSEIVKMKKRIMGFIAGFLDGVTLVGMMYGVREGHLFLFLFSLIVSIYWEVPPIERRERS